MKLDFYKMQGLGNDFVIIDGRTKPLTLSPEQVKSLSNRRYGIGCDQLIIIQNAQDADVEMLIFNQDGTRAESCGNATRCVISLIESEAKKTDYKLKVSGKILAANVNPNGLVTVNMGAPDFEDEASGFVSTDSLQSILKDYDEINYAQLVSMGNPHLILFFDNITEEIVNHFGPKFSVHPIFKNGCNINFVHIINSNEIILRVYERGVGETLACGSGACASVAAMQKLGLGSEQVKVNLAGGPLLISTNNSEISMTGPGTFVFAGSITA